MLGAKVFGVHVCREAGHLGCASVMAEFSSCAVVRCVAA